MSATRHRDHRLISKMLIGNTCNALRLTRVLGCGALNYFVPLRENLPDIFEYLFMRPQAPPDPPDPLGRVGSS